MSSTRRLFLIDGMGIAYRSYYAFINRPLINSKGQNTSPIFGFINFLGKIIEDQHPDFIAVAFDTPAPTFRHQDYADYKAHRQKMPEDMSAMMPMLKEVIRAHNIPILELPGYEADDIIGTLARQASAQRIDSLLVTSDKDLMQLVSSHVKIYRPGKQGDSDEILDAEAVVRKLGVDPKNVIDLLSLMGDSSDNIPGVPGIGPKTALPLIQQFGTLENILAGIDTIAQKGIREKLITHRELAVLSKHLATIDTNAPVQLDLSSLKYKERNTAELLRLYNELEFRSLSRKLKEAHQTDESEQPREIEISVPSTIVSTKHSYVLVDSDNKYKEFLAEIMTKKEFAVDTETTSIDPLSAHLVGVSFSWKPHTGYYLPVELSDKDEELGTSLFTSFATTKKRNDGFRIPQARLIRDLKPFLENPGIRKYGQNMKYDMLVLSQLGIWIQGISFDTMVASYIIRADGKHNLDALAAEYLQYKMISYDELTEGGKKQLVDIPDDLVTEYSAEDADITYQLSQILHDKIAASGMMSLCTSIEFPLISILADMERTGVKIDCAFLAAMSEDLEARLRTLTSEIYSLAGEQFNINSTQQLGTILFEKLQIPPVRKTKTGYSTDMSVLEAIRTAHPMIGHLLRYRQLAKLKSTYVDALPKLVHPQTDRVHTSFNQTVTATGRLSSSDPNLQNIPIRTEIGREIRKAFIPSAPDRLILSADYSQIELRIMAHVCGDEGLRQAFLSGEDIHNSTAAKVFGVPINEVSRDMRRKAKEVNFGIMYGIGAYGLAARLETTQTEAKEIISRYFERFPKVNQYIAETIAQARRDGYVSTLSGRRRYLPEINSRNAQIRQNAERQAINMPIQGTAADLIKTAMINIYAAMRAKGLRSSMVLQVHDELVFDLLKNEEKRMRSLVANQMKNAMNLSIPLEVELGTGNNWLSAHK